MQPQSLQDKSAEKPLLKKVTIDVGEMPAIITVKVAKKRGLKISTGELLSGAFIKTAFAMLAVLLIFIIFSETAGFFAVEFDE